MTVALLWVGYYEPYLDGVFQDIEKAKDHVNTECRLQGWPFPTWNGSTGFTMWEDGSDRRVKYWTTQEVEVH